jgi:hypothetical protein
MIPTQASFVHWFPSSQLCGGWEQAPVTMSQTSSVQGMPSAQSTGAPWQVEPPVPSAAHASEVVQALPSSQGSPEASGAPVQTPLALQESGTVQGLWSSQSVPSAMVPTHWPWALQASVSVQAS